MELVAIMNKWFIFFMPKKYVKYVTGNSNFSMPFIVNGIMSILNDKIYGTLGLNRLEYYPSEYDEFIYIYIGLSFLSPMLIAVSFHGLTYIIGVRGSLERLVRLFYYTFVGMELCTMLVGMLLWIISFNRMLDTTLSAILSLYSLGVSIYLINENYSITLSKTLVLTLIVLILLISLSLIIFLLWFFTKQT